MPFRTRWRLLVLASLLVAGCSAPEEDADAGDDLGDDVGDGTDDQADDGEQLADGDAFEERFDASDEIPADWSPDFGDWSVEADASAPSPPNVLHAIGGGGRSTLKSTGNYRDFEATIEFQMVDGDEGAGLSFRYTADGDYRIVRYSVRESGWHYFLLEGGAADKPGAATVAQTESSPTYGEWVTLKVRAEGKHIQAWDGETLVIDHTEEDEPETGAIGPFVRGSAEALFDDLVVTPLPG